MATLQEIADAWGCSQPYISKLKNKGMPKKHESTEAKIRKSFFDKYVDKIKEFLDNAE